MLSSHPHYTSYSCSDEKKTHTNKSELAASAARETYEVTNQMVRFLLPNILGARGGKKE